MSSVTWVTWVWRQQIYNRKPALQIGGVEFKTTEFSLTKGLTSRCYWIALWETLVTHSSTYSCFNPSLVGPPTFLWVALWFLCLSVCCFCDPFSLQQEIFNSKDNPSWLKVWQIMTNHIHKRTDIHNHIRNINIVSVFHVNAIIYMIYSYWQQVLWKIFN